MDLNLPENLLEDDNILQQFIFFMEERYEACEQREADLNGMIAMDRAELEKKRAKLKAERAKLEETWRQEDDRLNKDENFIVKQEEKLEGLKAETDSVRTALTYHKLEALKIKEGEK